MSSERRHELQQNELAVYLGRILKPLEQYSVPIGIAVAVVVLGLIGFTLYSSGQSGDRSDATLQLLQATGAEDADQFEGVADRYPSTAAATFARLYQADQLMARGMQLLFEDRTEAEDYFEGANSAYRQVLSASKDVSGVGPTITSRAHFGLARIAEAKGEINDAIDAYQEVIAANESEAMVELANTRISALESQGTRDFLTWFGEQDFAPAEPSAPPALPDEAVLPDEPDMEAPPLDAGLETEAPTESTDSDSADDGETTTPKVDEAGEAADPVSTESDSSQENATESEDSSASDDAP